MTKKRIIAVIFLTLVFFFLNVKPLAAQPIPIPSFELGVGTAENPTEVALSLQILALITILSLAPAILILMTSFTRIIVVLSFLRNALGTQQMPPNQVLIGLSLFLTFFIMSPVWSNVYQDSLEPYMTGEINQGEAFELAMDPVREFMFKHTRQDDLALFVSMAEIEKPSTKEDIPTFTLIPAFVISELKTAFQIGFIIFIPFIAIDMIVASVLMSMGMMMVPPMMIALPFKLLLFVLVDGWHLVVRSLLLSF